MEKKKNNNYSLNENESIAPKELARLANCSLATVYNIAKKLGRLPTLEELAPKKPGRKKKYN